MIIIMKEQKSQSKNSRNVLFPREIKGYQRILSSLTINKKSIWILLYVYVFFFNTKK